MNANYFDLYVTLTLPENVNYKNLNEYLSRLINKCLLQDDILKNLHEQKCMKGYVFKGLSPIEQDKVYKAGKKYIFNINIANLDKAIRFRDVLLTSDHVISVIIRQKTFRPIKTLSTISPCIISIGTTDNHKPIYWTKKNSIALLYAQIDKNVKRKAVEVFGINPNLLEISDNFIESISVRNQKDIVLNYKNGKIFGFNVDIKVKADPTSQLLANICLACGLGERNSLGMGYCFSGKDDVS